MTSALTSRPEQVRPGTATVLARTSAAEWSRIWTVRSSWWFLLAAAVVVLGLSTIIGYDATDEAPGDAPPEGVWIASQATGMIALFGMLAMAVVTATADHGNGGIVPTLQWTPRRAVLLAARSGVIVVTTTLLGLLLVVTGCVLIGLIAPDIGLPVAEGVETAATLAFVYLTGTCLAVGLSLLLRSTAGALVSVLALMLVLPLLVAQFPYEWAQTLSDLMPGKSALYLVSDEPGMTATQTRTTLASWAVGALVLGGWRLLRTDADR